MSELLKRVSAIELKGSEKQVQWAKSLRAQKVAAFEAMGNRAVLRHLKPIMVEEEIQAMNAWTPVRLGWLAHLTMFQACSSDQAKYWIDNRSDDPLEWLRPAYLQIRPHYLQNPFPDE